MPSRRKKEPTQTRTISQMDFLSAQRMVESYKIPICPTFKAVKEKDVMGIEKKIPYPWAMKAIGKQLIHKSDAGGVKLNLRNTHEAMMAVHKLKKIKGYDYVVVQPMRKGIELIVGGKMDSQFGPTVLVGMGGIYTEVFKDSSIRIAPLNENDAREMIRELKIAPILSGVRGQKGINEKKLVQLLLGVSKLMSGKKAKELDLNPVIATPETVEAVDVRIINQE